MQNLEGTYILGETEKLKGLGEKFFKIPNDTSDSKLSDWVLNVLDNHPDRIVIEIGDRASESLKIGFHIRLSLEELRNKALCGITFVSEDPFELLIENLKEDDPECYNQILFTEGVHFQTVESGEPLKDLQLMLENSLALEAKDYKSRFLSKIHVKPTEKFGRHSLANAWGAYALGKAAGGNIVIEDEEFKKSLYFKYRSAANFDEQALNSTTKKIGSIPLPIGAGNRVNAKGKRVLLIDDEASKGWNGILKKIFKSTAPTDFVVIDERVPDYESLSKKSREIIEKSDFDLYLVDLRLNGPSENMDRNPDDFSGVKVLKKIKELNPGNQIISFTASNKAWNMKAVLDAGADGYYVKESPEYGFSKDFSKENYKQFQRDIENCFSRSYLRRIHAEIEGLNKLMSGYPDQDFAKSISSQLNISFDIIKLAKSKEQFAYAFIMLNLVIEIVNSQFISSEDTDNLSGNGPSKWFVAPNHELFEWDFDKTQKRFRHNNMQVVTRKAPEWLKMCGLYFQLWKKDDHAFVKDVKDLIFLRNKFVHNETDVLNQSKKNRVIYSPDGYITLFEKVKRIIGFITNA